MKDFGRFSTCIQTSFNKRQFIELKKTDAVCVGHFGLKFCQENWDTQINANCTFSLDYSGFVVAICGSICFGQSFLNVDFLPPKFTIILVSNKNLFSLFNW